MTMTSELTPTDGARFLFERERAEGTSADYRVSIYTPAATFAGHARLDEDGSAAVSIAAPTELVSSAQTFAKLIARAAPKRREQGLPPWPARVKNFRS